MSETFQWIDADGGILTIGGPGVSTYQVDWEASGRFMPRIETRVDQVPGQPGGLLREARHGIHEFILPLSIATNTESSLRTLLRDLVDRMDPVRGEGKLRVTSPVGDQREITCVYAAGLEMAEKTDVSGPTYQACPVAFTAHDPYWYDVSPTSKTFTITAVATFFPIFPLRLTASQLVVDDAVVNSGSVEAWPVWTITGPGADIKLTNLTTGEFISFPGQSITNDEILTIDTRPGAKSVTLGDGTNAYPWLDYSSTLWSLRRGNNSVRLEMGGADFDMSALSISYYQRYLSP